MKKYIFPSLLSVASFLFPFSSVVSAQTIAQINPCPGGISFANLCINAENTGVILQNAFNLAVLIAVIVAVGYLIYGGVRWVISRGDKQEVENARNHIVAAIVGLIIVFLAFFIINLVLKLFGVQNPNNLVLPRIVP